MKLRKITFGLLLTCAATATSCFGGNADVTFWSPFGSKYSEKLEAIVQDMGDELGFKISHKSISGYPNILKDMSAANSSGTTDDGVISSMWDTTIGAKDVTITASVTGTQASQVKYTTGASSYTNSSGKNVVRVLNTNLTSLTFTSKKSAEIVATSMYIGVAGAADTNEGSSALSLTFTFTPADVAAAGQYNIGLKKSADVQVHGFFIQFNC